MKKFTPVVIHVFKCGVKIIIILRNHPIQRETGTDVYVLKHGGETDKRDNQYSSEGKAQSTRVFKDK